MNDRVLNSIDSSLKSIDAKTNKTTNFKSIMFLAKYMSIYEPPLNTAIQTIRFSPAIELDSMDYELALMDVEAYFVYPNIDKLNNQFRYYSGKTSSWVTYTIPTGTYNIEDLQHKAIDFVLDVNQETKVNNKYAIVFTANLAALRTEMYIAPGYRVDFTILNSFRQIIGFNNQIYTEGTYQSENEIDILDVSSIYVNCDLISGSYVDGVKSPALYSFAPDVPPGYKMVEKATHLVFLPINRNVISTITVWLSDQDGKILNFRNQMVTMRLYLRKTPFK
jgi:hypothetical protein